VVSFRRSKLGIPFTILFHNSFKVRLTNKLLLPLQYLVLFDGYYILFVKPDDDKKPVDMGVLKWLLKHAQCKFYTVNRSLSLNII